MSRTSELVDRVRAASTRSADLGGNTPNMLSLALGEVAGPTPSPIVGAAIDSLHAGRTRYERLTGSQQLREQIAQVLSAGIAPRVGIDNVVITHGASAGLAAATMTVVDPGDVVVLPEPTYSLYADHVALAGGRVHWVPNHPDGKPRLDLIRDALPGAKLLVLCNPSNPTGYVLTPHELTALVDMAGEHGTHLIVDEAYRSIIFNDEPFASAIPLVPRTPRVICCGSFSKSFSMTGWRLGWVVAEPELADSINLVHRTLNGPINTFVQDAGVAAVRLPEEYLDSVVDELRERRDIVCAYLADVAGVDLAVPNGAFYAFPRIDRGLSSSELTALLASEGVLVRPGSEFGPSGEGHIRISFALHTDQLRAGMERLVDCLNRLPASASTTAISASSDPSSPAGVALDGH